MGEKRKRFGSLAILFVGAYLVWSILSVGHTQALIFSGSAYGECDYGTQCIEGAQQQEQTVDEPNAQTIVETPAGLQVAINLYDGQYIPWDGYTIVITPLNGRGASFAAADIYINDARAGYTVPDETGTARWFWDPRAHTGTKVDVHVLSDDGNTTTLSFTVRFASDTEPVPPAGSVTGDTTAASSASIQERVDQFFRSLPPHIAKNFPYLLFLLLGCNVLVVVILAYRELKAKEQELQRIEAAQRLTHARTTFGELVAHYLRTPISLLAGGLDMYPSQTLPLSVQGASERLRAHIANLVGETDKNPLNQSATAQLASMPPYRAWLAPSLYIPVLLAGLLAALFVYMAHRVHDFTVSEVQLAMQITIFALAVILLYLAHRQLHLRRYARSQAGHLLENELRVSKEREDFIAAAAQQLNGDVKSLSSATGQLPPSAGDKFVKKAIQRLQLVSAKFSVAVQLKGAYCADPYAQINLHELVDDSCAMINDKLTSKQAGITTKSDMTLRVQNRKLFSLALASLIDNAAEYSPPGSAITITAVRADKRIHIDVTDSGDGIPSDKLTLLFEPFSKVDSVEAFNHEGMGFSLYLDKLIMAYLGGDIAIVTTSSQGTTMRLTLPA